MWIDKLVSGVIEIETPIGPRYLEPNFIQRALLMWTFRNFFSLPQKVLRPNEVRLIDRLSSENRFISIAAHDRPIIGKIERRVPAVVDALEARKQVGSSVDEHSREAAA